MSARRDWRLKHGEYVGGTFESGILMRSGPEKSEVRPESFGSVHRKEIDCRKDIQSVAFFVDGKHIMTGGKEEMIRRWRVEDGVEVGTPMVAAGPVYDIAVSGDGKWIVSGTWQLMQVWNAENSEKLTEVKAHSDWVHAVDVSRDSTRIASGSSDCTVSVWSLLTGKRLLGPWKHDNWGGVIAVKFSPDGRRIATATWPLSSPYVRIYDSQDGSLLIDVPINVNSFNSHTLAWSNNSKQLFASSFDKIYCLEASTGATLSQWPISGKDSKSIALASNDSFIAVSSGSSVSFWDTTTHNRIGTLNHTAKIYCTVISADYAIAIASDTRLTLHSLCGILPSSYVSAFTSRAWLANLKPFHRSHPSRQVSHSFPDVPFRLTEKIVSLENVVQQLRNQLADSERAVNNLQKTIRVQEEISSSFHVLPKPVFC